MAVTTTGTATVCAKADGLLGEETESGGNTRSEARPNDETDGSVPIQYITLRSSHWSIAKKILSWLYEAIESAKSAVEMTRVANAATAHRRDDTGVEARDTRRAR